MSVTSGFADPRDFSLYVHIPYCVRKCPYCDFNSYGVGGSPDTATMPEQRYVDALCSELRAAEGSFGGRRIATVFFGGGTPSLFAASSIARILGAAERLSPLAADAEITLEANPGTVGEELGAEKLAGFRGAGVNRVSFGVQSFSPRKLELLGRIHGERDARAAIENVRRAGFENFNIDLIFGVEGESTEEWAADLREALAIDPPHISAYGLTIEPGTEFGRLARRGKNMSTGDDAQAELYRQTVQTLSAAGFERYETSNYARRGKECRHNLVYWSRGDYLGIGAGAHSFLSGSGFGSRWSNIPGPGHYIERALASGDARQKTEELDRDQAEMEYLFVALRKTAGISAEEFRALFGDELVGYYGEVLTRLASAGLLECRGEGSTLTYRLTERGVLFGDEVTKEMVRGRATP